MTEFFLKLLGAKMGQDVTVSGLSLAFRGGISVGWAVIIALALGALIWWMYRSSPAALKPVRKYILAGLRVLFLVFIVVLLMRPVLALTVEGSIRRLLVMLVDDSASMQIKDPRLDGNDQKRAAIAKNLIDPTKGLGQPLDKARLKDVEQVSRVDLLKGMLKNQKVNLLPRLEKDYDVNAFTFGQGVVELPRVSTLDTNAAGKDATAKKTTIEEYLWVDKLNPQGQLTSIGDSVREVINRKRGQPLAGVVLVTDGANNSGSHPRDVAAQLSQEGVPLYIYGIGITSPRDIIVGNIFAPDVTFVKDEVPVTVRFRSQGLKDQSAKLKLTFGGTVVDEKEIVFGADGEMVVPMRFTPPVPGDFELTASIEPRDDETVKDNNARSQHIKVIDSKIKVLLIDQSPRWEFRYLQAMMSRDRRVDLKCLLIEGDPSIARGTNSIYLDQFPAKKDDLFKYDLVIFGDVDPRKMPVTNLENLGELVSKFGSSFVMLAGKKYTPGGYRRTVIEKMLPVEFDGTGVESLAEVISDKPVRLELTAAGRANQMMRLSDKEDESVALWKQLPPVYWVAKVSRPKPAAEVLLVDPDPTKESRFGKMPVIALQQYGLGQVMYVGTDNTWRWRKNAGDLYYTTIWSQIAQRLSIQRLMGLSKRTQLTTDRQNYMTGDRVSVYARLYTAGYEPLQEPFVKGVYGLRSGGGGKQTDVVLRSIPEQPGLYRGDFTVQTPGQYQFFVEQDLNTPLEFNVTEPKFELGETAMNETMLREIAATTGGAFFREEDLFTLPEKISQRAERVKSPLEVELWSSPLYFLLLLGVVSAEWILRKMSHLK